jgi:hypothetical protein
MIDHGYKASLYFRFYRYSLIWVSAKISARVKETFCCSRSTITHYVLIDGIGENQSKLNPNEVKELKTECDKLVRNRGD